MTLGEDADEAPVRTFFGGAPPPELRYRRDDGRAAAEFGVDVLPATFLVVDGQLVARFSGAADWSSRAMRRLLSRLVTEARERGSPGARRG